MRAKIANLGMFASSPRLWWVRSGSERQGGNMCGSALQTGGGKCH